MFRPARCTTIWGPSGVRRRRIPPVGGAASENRRSPSEANHYGAPSPPGRTLYARARGALAWVSRSSPSSSSPLCDSTLRQTKPNWRPDRWRRRRPTDRLCISPEKLRLMDPLGALDVVSSQPPEPRPLLGGGRESAKNLFRRRLAWPRHNSVFLDCAGARPVDMAMRSLAVYVPASTCHYASTLAWRRRQERGRARLQNSIRPIGSSSSSSPASTSGSRRRRRLLCFARCLSGGASLVACGMRKFQQADHVKPTGWLAGG